ncbi:MAG: hypothetical protein QW286_02705 [Candidatus Aenigmatarchaeota archaeon]
MKAQTEVVTIVLITGIVITLVGSAYLWGLPLISKRTAVSDFLSAEDFVVKLDNKIVEIANSGSGEASLVISPKGLIRVYEHDESNPHNNSVIFEIVSKQPLLQGGNEVVLKTNILGENATYGEGEPRIITLSSQPYGQDYKLIFKIHYRELDMKNYPYKGYKIAIERGTISGTSSIKISYSGTEVIPGGAMTGSDLILTKIRVDVY